MPAHKVPLKIEQGATFDKTYTWKAGPLKALVAGIEKGTLRAWPLPNEAAEVVLDVFRLPKPVGEGDSFEIDEQHHMALLLWVKHKAYGKEDAETFNRAKSDEYEQRFYAYCAQARVEQERARRNTGNVAYGGL